MSSGDDPFRVHHIENIRQRIAYRQSIASRRGRDHERFCVDELRLDRSQIMMRLPLYPCTFKVKS
jgi:hypothetical protein